ncbi:hypothetical protein ACVW00_001947 [Marmoricola sp. URHA0025 HA25]
MDTRGAYRVPDEHARRDAVLIETPLSMLVEAQWATSR